MHRQVLALAVLRPRVARLPRGTRAAAWSATAASSVVIALPSSSLAAAALASLEAASSGLAQQLDRTEFRTVAAARSALVDDDQIAELDDREIEDGGRGRIVIHDCRARA